MRVGVLALQGGFAPHLSALRALDIPSVEVRSVQDLEGINGLVLPGGESTVQSRLMDEPLVQAVRRLVCNGAPVLATCAGVILAAQHGWLNVAITRNAYGPQLHSAEARADDGTPLVFIRAPRIDQVGEGVEVLTRFDGKPVLVRQQALVGATFHPELTDDLRVHALTFRR